MLFFIIGGLFALVVHHHRTGYGRDYQPRPSHLGIICLMIAMWYGWEHGNPGIFALVLILVVVRLLYPNRGA